MLHRRWLVSFALPVAFLSTAQGQPEARALLFGDPSSPLAQVPGQPGVLFSEAAATASLAVSPSGQRWAAIWGSSNATGTINNIIWGDQNGITGVFSQGELFPGLAYTIDRRPDESLSINEAGDIAATVVALGGSTLDRQRIVRRHAASGLWTEVARGDGVIPGLGLSIPGAEGERYPSAAFTSGTILDDGRIAISARGTRSILSSTDDELLLLSGDPVTLLAQGGVLVPTNQTNGATDVLTDIDDEVFTSRDGSSYLLTGDLARASGQTEVVVVNGEAVYEVGQSFPGLTGTTFEQPAAIMYAGGDWAYRGATTTGDAYIVVNGEFYLGENSPVPGGLPSELFDSFRAFAINEQGDIAVAGFTTELRFVIVLDPIDGTPSVALDDSTPFDIDGDGAPDQAFYNDVAPSQLWLGENRELIFIARLKDQFDLNIADGIFLVETEQPCPADTNGDDRLDPGDFTAWVVAYNNQDPECDQNGDDACAPDDFTAWLSNFNAGCD